MQCQFSLVYQVHSLETQTILFMQEKAQLPPVEQRIASHLLTSLPEASAECQERPKWVPHIGRLGAGVGITGTPLWVAGFLRWLQDSSAVCHAWTGVFSLSPRSWDQNCISSSLLVLGLLRFPWLSGVALVRPSLCVHEAGLRSV